ncbi:(R,R)-butanediol dehydrogenase/meso-butanediol dehydrogenase/diacetyl reductase [Novosphingobium capsulatum]|uniref:(R,R)-butanediol dehydrogenase/meso-butanediol dehydrogenase/diacetyl reductase n=1 Tax=Novosphingobium capsulatum TaxID=13688 RepID=A0ABU1MRY8_9SPHN|nr:alcohol dehydrogenase catalytic domain-containing protein [Novosphingobium capsulatum]MDR6513106.1 (R,R)-butanediol dehydrogenase/meso-butanediol dehydrogenase/diacetyl reductase [Novosphingobium capsulatum]
MKAAVFEAIDQPLRIENLADPEPGEGDVVVKVGRCGICGSDLHMASDPAYGCAAGDVFGHEFAGEVVATGRHVASLRPGDLVAVVPLVSCGACDHCRRGAVQWCAAFALQGGGYAEFAKTRQNQCIKLGTDVSLADGALVEPLAVALHGINRSGMKAGDKVLVLGAGPIGLALAFWARKRGAARVVVQDITPFQQERAIEMGADTFVVDLADPVGAADRALRGKADIVFECVGAPGLITQAVAQVKPQGTILLLGLCTKPDTLDTFAMLAKEVSLVTSAFFTIPDYEAALAVLDQGAIEPRLMISRTIVLDQVPQVFESLKQRTGDCKVMIAP